MYALAEEGTAAALPDADVRTMGWALRGSGYQVFLREGSLYAFKGLAGKLGPIGVHAAMLLIMGGALHAHAAPLPNMSACCCAYLPKNYVAFQRLCPFFQQTVDTPACRQLVLACYLNLNIRPRVFDLQW